jgi:hypothetical protein
VTASPSQTPSFRPRATARCGSTIRGATRSGSSRRSTCSKAGRAERLGSS